MGNFAGGGGGGSVAGTVTDVAGGTTNKLPKFSGAQTLVDSGLSDDGTTISTTEKITAVGFQTSALRLDFGFTTINQIQLGNTVNVAWSSNSLGTGTMDTFLSRSGAGGLRLGTSLGGTDGALSCATESLSGKITTYNGVATVGNGVPSLVAAIDTTGLTANVASALFYAVPASGAGMYRVQAYVVETVAGSISSTLPNAQILFTDVDSNTAITIDATPVFGVAGIGQTGALTSNTAGTASAGVIVINAKASTNINYQTVNYASNAAGMTYAIHILLEKL